MKTPPPHILVPVGIIILVIATVLFRMNQQEEKTTIQPVINEQYYIDRIKEKHEELISSVCQSRKTTQELYGLYRDFSKTLSWKTIHLEITPIVSSGATFDDDIAQNINISCQ